MTHKRALITGGGSGIGLAVAHALKSDGFNVIISGRSEDKLAKSGFDYVVMNVTDESSINAAFAKTGPVDVFVNNAGNAETAPLLETSSQMWNDMIAVNMTAAFLCAKAALPPMIDKGWGRFIVVASTASLKSYPYSGAYSSAKHGVLGVVNALALELAKTGVTSNAVCPGFTQTEILTRSVDTIMAKTGRTKEQALGALVKDNPMKRAIQPAEVASAISWLASEAAGSINGLSLPIDGGELIS